MHTGHPSPCQTPTKSFLHPGRPWQGSTSLGSATHWTSTPWDEHAGAQGLLVRTVPRWLREGNQLDSEMHHSMQWHQSACSTYPCITHTPGPAFGAAFASRMHLPKTDIHKKKTLIATRLESFKFRKGIINIHIYHFIVGRNRENRQHCALRPRISRDFWQHMLQKTVAAVTSQLELLLVEVIEKWDEGKIQVKFR